jgi:hypothetical protein
VPFAFSASANAAHDMLAQFVFVALQWDDLPKSGGAAVRRREFITLIRGAALVWPRRTWAQQSVLPVIGFVHARSREDTAHLVAAFRQGLVENGYVEDKNVAVEFRFAAGQYSKLTDMVAELVRRPVAVLVTGADPAAVAGKHATTTVPIVFAVGGDPVKLALVQSLNRPGGNATGTTILTTSLEPKRLGLLREMLPPNATLGVFLNPALPLSQKQSKDKMLRVRLVFLRVFFGLGLILKLKAQWMLSFVNTSRRSWLALIHSLTHVEIS